MNTNQQALAQQLPPRFRSLWVVLCGAAALSAIASYVLPVRTLLEPDRLGDLGATLERTNGTGAQHVTVHGLGPHSPLRSVGIEDGDHLQLDRPWNDLLAPQAGETFAFTRLSPGPASRLSVLVPSAAADPQRLFAKAVLIGGQFLTMLTGLFIVWRSRSAVAQLALGMAFVCFGTVAPQAWPLSAAAFPFWAVPIWAALTFAPSLFLRFSMDYDGRSKKQRSRWDLRLFYTLIVVQAFAFVVEVYCTLENVTFPMVRHIRGFSYALQIFGLVFPCYLLARGWLRSAPAERKRYVVMLIALPLTFLPTVIILLFSLLVSFNIDSNSPLVWMANVSRVCGPLLFAYAVLRHKILDLGFAINRALVFGVVSILVLIASGLLEWVSEHFIHVQGRDKNALLDAGFALAVFLTFHRVWSFVENRVESLLFHKWHSNEAALKRFVKEAAFIGKSRALSTSFMSELVRFSGGAHCALYLRGDNRNYALAEGSLSDRLPEIDADDPALVTLRANRESVELDETRSTLPAALALPMMLRDDLSGLVLMDDKPSGEGYRPDEIDVLGWAAHQIGLDLHTLQVAQLEQVLASLRHSNAELAARNADLLALRTLLGDAARAI
jgi:hypothetical protein